MKYERYFMSGSTLLLYIRSGVDYLRTSRSVNV